MVHSRDGGRWNLARVPGERRHFLPCQEEALPCAGPKDSSELRTGFYKASLAFLKVTFIAKDENHRLC